MPAVWLSAAVLSTALGVACLFSGNSQMGLYAAFLAVVSVLGLATGDD